MKDKFLSYMCSVCGERFCDHDEQPYFPEHDYNHDNVMCHYCADDYKKDHPDAEVLVALVAVVKG